MSETPTLTFDELQSPSLPRAIEKSLQRKGHHFVIGVDEAGRGPLAGPVVASAFTFSIPRSPMPSELAKGVTDSKKVGEQAREHMYHNNICGNSQVMYKVSIVDNKVIDKINILQATFKAMSEACLGLISDIKKSHPTVTFSILIDGNKIPPQLAATEHECKFVIKGDSIEFLIAAASICAKVERDAIMRRLDEELPQYGFGQHKGYPTRAHVAAVSKHGPCKYHRMTFAPLKHMKASKKSKSSIRGCISKPSVEEKIDARAQRLKRRNASKSD